jgi:hypothetical protein
MQSALAAVVLALLKPQAVVGVVEQVDILLAGLLFPTQSQLELAVLELQLLV